MFQQEVLAAAVEALHVLLVEAVFLQLRCTPEGHIGREVNLGNKRLSLLACRRAFARWLSVLACRAFARCLTGGGELPLKGCSLLFGLLSGRSFNGQSRFEVLAYFRRSLFIGQFGP